MKRLLIIIKTELLATRTSLPFHIIALLSPILFLQVFAGQLDNDISFPVNFKNTESAFFHSIENYKSPAGTPYYWVNEENDLITINEVEEVRTDDDKFLGAVSQAIRSIDKNMTKNYRNRLTGALSNFFYLNFPQAGIQIEEHPEYQKDPAWSSFFAASILIFGILLSGLLFGTLSITREYETNGIILLKLSPITPAVILSGKLLGSLIKSFITISLYICYTSIKLKGLLFNSPGIILIILMAYITAILLGMLIGILLKQSLVAFITALISSILFWVLGGGFGTSAGMAKGIQFVININPISKYLKLTMDSCFKGSISLVDMIYPTCLFIILIFFLIFLYHQNIFKPIINRKQVEKVK